MATKQAGISIEGVIHGVLILLVNLSVFLSFVRRFRRESCIYKRPVTSYTATIHN